MDEKFLAGVKGIFIVGVVFIVILFATPYGSLAYDWAMSTRNTPGTIASWPFLIVFVVAVIPIALAGINSRIKKP